MSDTDALPRAPRCGDDVEAWLKRMRDGFGTETESA